MPNRKEIEMVKIAEIEIEKFAKEWQKTPYLWESETDVHAELYIRIKSSLRKKKFLPEKGNPYGDLIDEEYFDWIYCKPKTYIKKANYPDIVIYKDMGKKHRVGDRENEPMLWVCEIKYVTDWSSQLSKESVQSDIIKLKGLLKRKKGGVDCACYLILRRHIPLSKTIIKTLEGINKKVHLYHYAV